MIRWIKSFWIYSCCLGSGVAAHRCWRAGFFLASPCRAAGLEHSGSPVISSSPCWSSCSVAPHSCLLSRCVRCWSWRCSREACWSFNQRGLGKKKSTIENESICRNVEGILGWDIAYVLVVGVPFIVISRLSIVLENCLTQHYINHPLLCRPLYDILMFLDSFPLCALRKLTSLMGLRMLRCSSTSMRCMQLGIVLPCRAKVLLTWTARLLMTG